MAENMVTLGAHGQVLMTRPREEWKTDVGTRYRALEQFSKEDAQLQFLRILRSLPYGALFFYPCPLVSSSPLPTP